MRTSFVTVNCSGAFIRSNDEGAKQQPKIVIQQTHREDKPAPRAVLEFSDWSMVAAPWDGNSPRHLGRPGPSERGDPPWPCNAQSPVVYGMQIARGNMGAVSGTFMLHAIFGLIVSI